MPVNRVGGLHRLDDERPHLDEAATAGLVERARAIRTDTSMPIFETRQRLARILGAHHDPDTGRTEFGFWAPELVTARLSPRDVSLELFEPLDDIDFGAPFVAFHCRRTSVPLEPDGDYWWAAVAGVRAGDRQTAGTFYWIRAVVDGEERIVHDLLPDSIPYGSFAPAEVYDMVGLQRDRHDLDHFAEPAPTPTSILELHIPTATPGGTIGDLADVYREIARRIRAGEPLEAAYEVYAGYDAIQPLPVDPTIERRAGAPTFWVVDTVDEIAGVVGVVARHPENQNWGYDNIVAGSSAVNPSLLRSRRPHEIVELAEALHDMPEPMMLLYDIVYGHADNQALEVLPSRFFKGPNMYGQDLNHQDPTVRAILLEMQRRRVNSGCDGLRVDGAQDFKFYDPRSGRIEYDDDYLASMSSVDQEIGPHSRRVWMIFEDGRPWPEEGWEVASTYRDVIAQQPGTYQWGPLIFAHNTPMLDGFWRDKWWRVEQIRDFGGHWISGCANHDTVRRGTQVDPARPINRWLGDDLPEILQNAYENPAVTAISYALLPGIPMDFLQATTRTPWAFMRTTDDLYGVKVMTEEAGFLDWQLRDDDFVRPEVFARTKRHGFTSRSALRAFLERLGELVDETDYDLEAMAVQSAHDGLRPGAEGLLLLANDYMQDVHDLCNVGPCLETLDPARSEFNLELRKFRRTHAWLREDCAPGDVIELVDGDQIVYRGRREAPDGTEAVAVVANMAGPPTETPARELVDATWHTDATDTIVTPGTDLTDPLSDGAAVVWRTALR